MLLNKKNLDICYVVNLTAVEFKDRLSSFTIIHVAFSLLSSGLNP